MAENIIVLGEMAVTIGLLILWSGSLGNHKTEKKEGDRE